MIRSIIWYIYFFLSLVIAFPALLRVKYLEKKGDNDKTLAFVDKCAKLWAGSLLKLAGVKVIVHGKENLPKDTNVLFIGNHQGNFDIPIYIKHIDTPKGFVSKIEVEKIPGVAAWMKAMKCIFMDRSNLRKSGEAIINGVKNLKAGYSLVIFPEGTRSKGDKLGDFKAGSFKLATKSKKPIVPVTMDGSYRAMEASNPSWVIKPCTVNLYIHPAIDVANMTKEELDNLHLTVPEIISSKLPKAD